MKKILQISLALLVSMPVCSQSLIPFPRLNHLSQESGILVKSAQKNTVSNLLPKESKRYDLRSNASSPYIITYDIYGHEISAIIPSGLANEIYEYDPTGKILLNKYKATRKNVSDDWTKPEKYMIRTTVNAEGIRTAMEHEAYTSINLNDQGLVTNFKAKPKKGVTTEGTLKWNGFQLAGLTLLDKATGSEQLIELNDLEIFYTSADLNPYEISYYDLIAYGVYETNPIFIGINATGTITGTSAGQSMSAKMTFSSRTEDKQEGMYEAPRTMKGYTKGDLFLSMDICNYKFTRTDANGSFIFEDRYNESVNGYPSVYTYTINYDQFGNVTKEQGVTVENDKVKVGEIYRFAWTYDSDNKPLKLETYYSMAPDYKETLIKKEEFTAWYDPASINTVELTEGKVLGATLYTLSGTQIRELSAEEVDSNIEIPVKGVYLLQIHTDKGSFVKKIMK